MSTRTITDVYEDVSLAGINTNAKKDKADRCPSKRSCAAARWIQDFGLVPSV
jgi:hypothetical protein